MPGEDKRPPLNQIQKDFALRRDFGLDSVRHDLPEPPAKSLPFSPCERLSKEMKTVSLRQVARTAGVSIATASRAIRNSPVVRPELARKVHATAKTLGYVHSAEVSSVMREFRKNSGVPPRGTLAFLACDSPASWTRPEGRFYQALFDAAQRRAQAQGYRLEVFLLEQPNVSNERIAHILHARGIAGVLLAPAIRLRTEFRFPWEQFVSSVIGNFQMTPVLHRVSRDFYLDTRDAWERLRVPGYRRIGYVASAEFARRSNFIGLAAYGYLQSQIPAKERIPALCEENLAAASFERWFAEHRPEALICESSTQVGWVRSLRTQRSRRTPCVCLSVQPSESDVTGVMVPYAAIGEAAVDQLTKLVEQREVGLPSQPRALLVRGLWQEAGQAVA